MIKFTPPAAGKSLIDAACDNPETKQLVEARIRERALVSKLVAARAAKGVTQSQLASQRGCTQSAVSKLESGLDANVTIADIEAYAKAIDGEVRILITPRGKGLAQQIKHHAFAIRRAFARLVELAHTDPVIADGVAKLHIEAFQNINRMLAETADRLPVNADNKRPRITMTVSDESECDPSQDVVQKNDKPAKKPRASTRLKRSPGGAIATPSK